MSLIDTMRSWFGGSSNGGAYLVDVAGTTGQAGDRMGPRDQLQALDRLAKFAQHEGVTIMAVIDGKPLREVDEGGDYKGVTVHFTKREQRASDLMIQMLKGRKRHAVAMVITADEAVEELARQSGKKTMRCATLRRAMDAGGGGSSHDRGGNSGRSVQRRRGGRRRGPRNGDNSGKGAEGERKESAGTPEKSGGGEGAQDNAVRSLIDLVD